MLVESPLDIKAKENTGFQWDMFSTGIYLSIIAAKSRRQRGRNQGEKGRGRGSLVSKIQP